MHPGPALEFGMTLGMETRVMAHHTLEPTPARIGSPSRRPGSRLRPPGRWSHCADRGAAALAPMLPSVRVSAPATDTAPPPPDGVRFFEVAIDDRTQAYFIAIAPHGGAIEPHTDDEAEHLRLSCNHVDVQRIR